MSGPPPAAPASKDEVIALIEAAREDLDAILTEYPEEELVRPGPEGWSAKDHLAHVAAWERGVAALLRGEDRAAAMGVPQDLWDAGDEDAINAVLQRRDAARPLAEVVAAYRAAHQELMAEIGRLSWDDLHRGYATYRAGWNPDSAPGDPVGYTVAGNTFGHYPDHARWIRELIHANRATADGPTRAR